MGKQREIEREKARETERETERESETKREKKRKKESYCCKNPVTCNDYDYKYHVNPSASL